MGAQRGLVPRRPTGNLVSMQISCLSLLVIMLPRAELTVPSQEEGCDTVKNTDLEIEDWCIKYNSVIS